MATKKYRCKVCGYIHEGDKAPDKCPVCQAPASEFELIEDGGKAKKGIDKNGNAYIAVTTTDGSGSDEAAFDTDFCAVTVDGEGVVTSCYIDTVQASVGSNVFRQNLLDLRLKWLGVALLAAQDAVKNFGDRFIIILRQKHRITALS